MATNSFLPFASGSNANVLTDAQYQSDLASGGTYTDGVVSGQAASAQANKVWRQSTAMSSALGQLIVTQINADASDSQATATLAQNLGYAIQTFGGVLPFNADFSNAVNGYPKNAIVADASTAGLFWVSTADNNTTTPGASGASWTPMGYGFFVNQGKASTTLATGNVVSIGLRTGVTSGAARVGMIIDSTDFGDLATIGAANLAQGAWTEQYYTLPSQGNKTISLTFNAPLPGIVHVEASANYANQNSNQTNLNVAVNGTILSADQVTLTTCMSNGAAASVSPGTVTVSSYCGTSADSPPNVGHTLRYLYVPS